MMSFILVNVVLQKGSTRGDAGVVRELRALGLETLGSFAHLSVPDLSFVIV
jgi:hypothetical protein